MVPSQMDNKSLDLQAATEQGDVSVGELTDLECGRDIEKVEDCAPDATTPRQ